MPLPEITKLEEVPSYVAGIVNFHGRVVPIIDMHLRFGHSPQPYRLEDALVFLERSEKTIGILVNEPQAVHEFELSEFAPMARYGFELNDGASQPDARFISGVAAWNGKMAMRLHTENLFDFSMAFEERYLGMRSDNLATPERSDILLSTEIAILRERALKLTQIEASDESSDVTPLAIVRIEAEFFGIALDVIREFAELRNVTPIPCCPDHVIGQMNLRGDLITITDLGLHLGLQPASGGGDRKVVVMNDPMLAAGVMVDELLGVLYPAGQTSGLTGRTGRALGQDFRRDSISDGDRTLSVLDLPKLLSHASLIVNERPS